MFLWSLLVPPLTGESSECNRNIALVQGTFLVAIDIWGFDEFGLNDFRFRTFRNSTVFPSNTLVYCKTPGFTISEYSTIVALRFRIVQVIVGVRDSGRPTLTSPSGDGGGFVSGVYVFLFAHNIAIVSFRINFLK